MKLTKKISVNKKPSISQKDPNLKITIKRMMIKFKKIKHYQNF
jgi:hypothetical protein